MMKNLNGMSGARFITFVAASMLSVSRAEMDFPAYEECVRGPYAKPWECTEKHYQPVLQTCRDRIDECLPWIANAKIGGLSFKRTSPGGACRLVAKDEDEYRIEFALSPGTERSEARDAFEAPYGQAMIYELEFRLPRSAKLTTENQSLVLAQLHAMNGHSPVVALRWKDGGELAVTLRSATEPGMESENGIPVELWRGPFALGVWHRFRIEVLTGVRGRVRVFHNQRKTVDYAGPVGYRDLASYFKFGLYDWTKSSRETVRMDVRDYFRRAGD